MERALRAMASEGNQFLLRSSSDDLMDFRPNYEQLVTTNATPSPAYCIHRLSSHLLFFHYSGSYSKTNCAQHCQISRYPGLPSASYCFSFALIVFISFISFSFLNHSQLRSMYLSFSAFLTPLFRRSCFVFLSYAHASAVPTLVV